MLAVKIVGWGIQDGIKFWKVANSWGTGYLSGGGFWAEWRAFPEGGFFKIKRGTNFCGIESSMCYAGVMQQSKTAKDTRWKTELAQLKPSQAPGAFFVLQDTTDDVGIDKAKSHMVQGTNTRRSSDPEAPSLSSDPKDYHIKQVRTQVVAGINYHITLETADTATGKMYTLDSVVHRDISGVHTTLAATSPRESKGDTSSSFSKILLIPIVGGGATLAIVVAAAFYIYRSRRASDDAQTVTTNEDITPTSEVCELTSMGGIEIDTNPMKHQESTIRQRTNSREKVDRNESPKGALDI